MRTLWRVARRRASWGRSSPPTLRMPRIRPFSPLPTDKPGNDLFRFKNCMDGTRIVKNTTLQICRFNMYQSSVSLLYSKNGYLHRGRKRPKHSFSSIEIHSSLCSAAFSHVQHSPLVTISICVKCVTGKGGVELFWRPYTAELLHSV